MDRFEQNNQSNEERNERVDQEGTEKKEESVQQSVPVQSNEREESEETRVEKSNKKEKSKIGQTFLAGLLGGVIASSAILGGAYVYNKSDVIDLGANQTAPKFPTSVINVSEQDLTSMIQEAKKSVVGITSYQSMGSFFGSEYGDKEAGSGSGVVYKKEGDKAYIITNNHVVAGAKKLEVKLDDGTKLEAKLLGGDPWLDLAVLEVDGKQVQHVAKFGNSDDVLVGEPAIAIGNPLGFLEGTVTRGIISSKERLIPMDIDENGSPDWEAQVIQTDASINPGNSGGALLNAKGEVIGINSSKIAKQSVEGIGFAIPINVAKAPVESLEKHGEVKRPYLGVGLYPLEAISNQARAERLRLPNDVTSGVIVESVEAESPAEEAGLKMYDVIVSFDDQPIKSVVDLRKHLFEKKQVGESMKVSYYRDGKIQHSTVKLAETKAKR
ncbi:S1C family serine protease [Priestia taiwanensis]|uniref:Serine protease n=1 Tax=Priestia taiwanensis TaxID=1347902 RepID=A0A917AQ53_9BACI|nr:trypsin-like peptidase domain-containing protein [Priestia taiwanensis]MBM7362471.1 serine protease Do [Priestia taiwanensis]GGE62496.1 serine protease [Priestia taiwanensis]